MTELGQEVRARRIVLVVMGRPHRHHLIEDPFVIEILCPTEVHANFRENVGGAPVMNKHPLTYSNV